MPYSAPPENVVALARTQASGYGALPQPVAAPELPGGEAKTVAQAAVRELFRNWRLDPEHFGSRQWNPLRALIAPGARLVLKPNWVVHMNESGDGLDCLVTHTSVIEAVLQYVVLARPASVVLGDAPIQRCDFEKLRRDCNLDEIVSGFLNQGLNLALRDFRRTLLAVDGRKALRLENRAPIERFVVFDMKEQSLLEPVTEGGKFRVTVYNPDLLERTHCRGRHQYLVARDTVEADLVINLPKLKCHQKACITGALKNLVGINGNKEYLPHHRKGGGEGGGDCYSGRWFSKRIAEDLLDWANRSGSPEMTRGLVRAAEIFTRSACYLGADDNLEGAWYGNDTIWRTCLDLQRILVYGRSDGSLADERQRQVVTITDAVLAGEGNGPLAPAPVNAGFVSGALNPAAADWVHARLMGFDPLRIPLVRESFSEFSYPVATFAPGEIEVRTMGEDMRADEVEPVLGRSFLAPPGWHGHCELEVQHAGANR
jgi:uncharacterized protein (DUF362 family)